MRIHRLFNLPASIEGELPRPQVLYFTICSLLFSVNTFAPILFYVLPENWRRWLAVLLVNDLVLPFLLALNRRGRTSLAGVLLLVMLWSLATGMAVTGGGIHAIAILTYLIEICIAGRLFGATGITVGGIVGLVTTLGLALVEMTGHLPANQVAHTTFSTWICMTFFLELLVIFQFFYNYSMKAGLNQVSTELKRRKEVELALRQAHDEMESRVEERTAELQKINKDLESFSYSVSHDLRGPLRSIIGFATLLIQDHGAGASGEARMMLDLIKESATRMNQLVEQLLNLARVDRQPIHSVSVNLTALARKVMIELLAEQSGRKIDIRLADLPDCMGDPVLLRQVFINLLSNAIKFTRNGPVPLIEVGCKMENANTVYYVRDNGAGFDMEQAEKLFGVFQRLHSSQEFPGIGVGLSIVQRIIHRHGGTIWAEGAVDRGATFYFTLPKTSITSDKKVLEASA
jgi:signal transduction histidine kinase